MFLILEYKSPGSVSVSEQGRPSATSPAAHARTPRLTTANARPGRGERPSRPRAGEDHSGRRPLCFRVKSHFDPFLMLTKRTPPEKKKKKSKSGVCNLSINKTTRSPEHFSHPQPPHPLYTFSLFLRITHTDTKEKFVHPSWRTVNPEFGGFFSCVHPSGPAPQYLAAGNKSYLDASPLRFGSPYPLRDTNPPRSFEPSSFSNCTPPVPRPSLHPDAAKWGHSGC